MEAAQIPLSKKRIFKLCLIFSLIYFFSPNGLASLPGLTVSFLLKDVLKMSAQEAAYFSAITIIGWAIKPLWGIISDMFPIFGYRRKSYLILTTIFAGGIWLNLGLKHQYSTFSLLILFSLSSMMYAFMDVLCDALMVETGKPYNLTGRFQSVQWIAVYLASIITGYASGWVAQNLKPQKVFSINAIFPVIILFVVLFFLKEEKAINAKEQVHKSISSLKEAFREKRMWFLAFFLFFWTFSPSFGVPFFYYSVDKLKFDAIFLGTVNSVSAITSIFGALLYAKLSLRINTRKLIKFAIIVGVIATLFDLIYFTNFVTNNLKLARYLKLISSAILGAIGALTFLVVLNAAALACPRYSEGTTFATLTSFWNIGLIGSSAFGGFLFGKIGLQPLIVVSALFTAATWLILPYLKFGDEEEGYRSGHNGSASKAV